MLTIGGRNVGQGEPVFIVAEIGLNHNGSLDTALEMVRAAKAAGADAVKVQAFSATCFTTARATWKGESQADMFRRYELPREAFSLIADECRREGLVFFGTPDCPEHARWLVDAGAPCIKVGSDDLTNTPLIRHLATYGLPLILSTGMADKGDIEEAALAAVDVPVAVLYCCSVYPAPLGALRFLRMGERHIGRRIHCGFSDHTIGPTAAAVAVALGATIIEKHFTLDHSMPGPDHQWSADPTEFRILVDTIRGVETAIAAEDMDPAEEAMKITAHRSVVAARDLPAGHVLTDSDMALKRPGDGESPRAIERMFGRKLKRALSADDLVMFGDLE